MGYVQPISELRRCYLALKPASPFIKPGQEKKKNRNAVNAPLSQSENRRRISVHRTTRKKPRIGPIIFSFLCTTRTHIFTNSVVFATVKLYLQLFVCGYSKGVWYTEHPCPFLDITSHGNKTVFTLAGYQSMTIVFKPEK